MQERLQTLDEHILVGQSEFPSIGVVHQSRVVATVKHENENRETLATAEAVFVQVEPPVWHPAQKPLPRSVLPALGPGWQTSLWFVRVELKLVGVRLVGLRDQ